MHRSQCCPSNSKLTILGRTMKQSYCWETTQPGPPHPPRLHCIGRGGCSLPHVQGQLRDQGGTGGPHTVRQGRLERHCCYCHRVFTAGTAGAMHLTTQSRAWIPPTIKRVLTNTSLPRTKNWMLNGPVMAKAFAIFFVAAFTYKNT